VSLRRSFARIRAAPFTKLVVKLDRLVSMQINHLETRLDEDVRDKFLVVSCPDGLLLVFVHYICIVACSSTSLVVD
jgi:hypothetical protein